MPTAALPPMPKLWTDVAPVTPSVPATVALPDAAKVVKTPAVPGWLEPVPSQFVPSTDSKFTLSIEPATV